MQPRTDGAPGRRAGACCAMSHRRGFPLVILASFVVIWVPYWAFKKVGAPATSPAHVPSELRQGKELFQRSCGGCHTLTKGASRGIVAPDLDERLGDQQAEALRERVLIAIEQGGTGTGAMPAGIVAGREAWLIAEFVAEVSGARRPGRGLDEPGSR
jgi:mono/diheme cytochrome c family protein